MLDDATTPLPTPIADWLRAAALEPEASAPLPVADAKSPIAIDEKADEVESEPIAIEFWFVACAPTESASTESTPMAIAFTPVAVAAAPKAVPLFKADAAVPMAVVFAVGALALAPHAKLVEILDAP